MDRLRGTNARERRAHAHHRCGGRTRVPSSQSSTAAATAAIARRSLARASGASSQTVGVASFARGMSARHPSSRRLAPALPSTQAHHQTSASTHLKVNELVVVDVHANREEEPRISPVNQLEALELRCGCKGGNSAVRECGGRERISPGAAAASATFNPSFGVCAVGSSCGPPGRSPAENLCVPR